VNKYQADFINNLKFYRKQNGISQEKLAELCDVSTSTISCVESFHQNPSFDLILKIAEALSIHPADLFLRNTSKIPNQDLYRKYDNLLKNCESIPESLLPSIENLAQNLAEVSPNYTSTE